MPNDFNSYDFDSYWSAIGQNPVAAARNRQKSEERLIGFGYGLFDPFQRADLFAKKAGEAMGIPGAAEAAQEQEARIAGREAQYGNLAPGATLLGSIFSPAPLAVASGIIKYAPRVPRLAATMAGASSAAFAPTQPGVNYWNDVRNAAMFGGVLGLGTRAFGSMLNPTITPEAQKLTGKGVKLDPALAVTGSTQDVMKTSAAVKSLLNIGAKNDDVMNATFNNALANDILRPLGTATKETTKDALVLAVRDKISTFYDDAYKKIGTALPSKQLVSDVQFIQQQANAGMNVKTQKALDDIIQSNIKGRFNIPTQSQGFAISGEALKDMNKYFSELSQKLKGKAYDADVDVLALEAAVKQLRGSVQSFTEAVDPNGLIKLANRARAEQSVLERAAASSAGNTPFSAADLEKALLAESELGTLAAGRGKLQEKARDYLSVMLDKPISPYSLGRRTALAGAMLTGSTYAWLHNPVVASAALATLGVAPAFIKRAVQEPAFKQKLLGDLIKKHGPGFVSNIINQEAARNDAETRKLTEKFPDYTTPESNY